MPCILRYGANSSVRLDLSDGVLLAECGTPPMVALDDPAAAVARALEAPLDYPPLARSTTPGDRIVLALEPGMPQAGEITAAVVRCLVGSGVHPDGVVVLRTTADVEAELADPRRWLPDQVNERITLVTHDPAERSSLAYLAATDAGQPILLNRAITDADLVLPIGCVRSRTAAGYHGIFGPVFPTFSDHRTLARFRSPAVLDAEAATRKNLLHEVEQVAWLLGITLTIQVVPGPGDEILYVLAGEAGAVGRRALGLYESAWHCSAPRRASLVVAGIEGGSAQQTWCNVGRTLEAAEALVEDGGAVAVCCDLAARPGPALQQLAGARSRRAATKRVRKERPEDALPAAQLAQALDRVRVYLLSRLDPSLVEDLEIVPIAEPDELVRLARQHQSCILLSNASHAVVALQEEA